MKKGLNYLFVSFAASVATSFFAKIGAMSVDILLFTFIAYSISSLLLFNFYMPKRNKISKHKKMLSIKYGIIVGMVNFLAFITFMTAASIGPGSLIIPMLGISIAVIAVFSMLIFKERMNWKEILGFFMALIALFLLT